MIQYLKEGRSAADAKADQSKVRQTVEKILAEIELRGDAAVQDLAQKFDKWERPHFIFPLFFEFTHPLLATKSL